MVIGASGKGARGVADATILDGRHVVARFTNRRDTMTRGAIIHDAGMIDECAGETIRVMAHSTIGAGCRVSGNGGRLAARINTVVVIMARSTRLYRWIDHPVVENTTETEGRDAVACIAIDGR